ncbi:hypothetical protein [Actinoplanes sp. NPDC049599]|uniref:hypothetical protein n=1 Tax=Actinoplanes sp. NPDC049599 TaxID=3363903 RepID=UPI0037B98771
MSDPQHSLHPNRRAAGVVLGSLATGAMLSAAAAGLPAVSAAAAPSTVHQQFDEAFTPGAVAFAGSGAAIVVNVV